MIFLLIMVEFLLMQQVFLKELLFLNKVMSMIIIIIILIIMFHLRVDLLVNALGMLLVGQMKFLIVLVLI